jgi:diguanylate cyclase (GGDEF)-like protein
MMYQALQVPLLKRQATVDDRTGLWNARYFAQLFGAELKRAARFDRPLTFIMADLDLLRNINNTYGHLAGDAVLAGIGRIIKNSIREYDIAGRFGGEEFAIALPETTLSEARALAERMRKAIQEAVFESPANVARIKITMSFGLAAFPGDGAGFVGLVHQADLAVYQAKLRGRNNIVSAAELPLQLKTGNLPSADRISSPYVPTFEPRPSPTA